MQSLRAARQPDACKPGGDPQAARPKRPAVPRAAECSGMRKTYGVVPGQSWGRLSPKLQTRWQRLACDSYEQA